MAKSCSLDPFNIDEHSWHEAYRRSPIDASAMDKIEANWWQENVPAAIWQRAKYAAQMHRSSGGPEGYV